MTGQVQEAIKREMKMKLIVITALTAFLFFECKKREVNHNTSEVNHDTSIETSLSVKPKSVDHLIDTMRGTLITDNSFILRTENDLRLERFKSIYKPRDIRKEIFQNKYEPEKRDTLISYYDGGDSISFYMSPAKSFPYKLVITSDRVTIDKYIKVGVAKDMFSKNFKVDELSDTVVVEDMGRFSSFTFCFNRNRLAKIIYQAQRIE